MNITRKWAMPSADTFDCPPIGEFVKSYLRNSKVSVDPFARNKRWATYTNDLNPETAAEYHMDALDFLRLMKAQGVQADLILFDPPYSPRQMKEVYDSIDRKLTQEDTWRPQVWQPEKDLCRDLLTVGGVFLSFGWSSHGLGSTRYTKINEILLICHGSGHNDTICMAERKLAHQAELFAALSETHATDNAPNGR